MLKQLLICLSIPHKICLSFKWHKKCLISANRTNKMNFSMKINQFLEGKYILGEQIGSGSYGVVYEAIENKSNKKVAIKVFLLFYS